ncbi:SDR family oxidoreductase [Achromobacter sp. K91]|jgi:NAD(P)-dependent dehydrogenase (short-subunit alcohol dehydrogenase family)|uniref:SDR family oxidoreductase n=1 Tax=Achromobacter aegrifaciens TaxID=1287736 RepID=A0AAD2J060_ACHAE|nr:MULTISPECIES: SDR family oxidoreductase [Achromobacter]PTN52090.1 KR domain-containing protein [Achromobacter xylosoxidans]MBD9380083.1 SDR family oxidoreductase [Achromobacter sp. ACM02]MBD9418470.1 SDR family oxidoreductase [Achromobacter sp. ACM04]MBD9428854.1 SDR family oxidoreductase [Achromobacter sp. ACM03]MBD9473532.1 SDR family oxidoreductase [Achromobacter sp. ACM01]
MDLQLKGKVAVVTGGSLGIGRAVTEALAAEGVRVAIVARRQAQLDEVAAEITRATGVEVLGVAADVSDTAQVNAMMQRVAEHFGRIDILVNGAAHPGGLVRSEIDEADPEGLLEDINIKVVGYMRCAKAAAPHMRQGGFGRIVNIGGLTGRGSKQLSGMRNVAICHMTKTLSDQLGPHGITVNVIHPGVVETPHIHELYEKEAAKQGLTPAQVEANYAKATPIRRVLQPAEIADAVLFLASPRAGAITGESLGVDGGITRGIFL